MPPKKLISLCLVFFSIAIIFPGRISAQGNNGIILPVDTSDYIPDIIERAVDYNLMIAAAKGYSTEVERLIRRGADVNAETDQGVTPLIFAVLSKNAEVVGTVLAFKPDIDKFNAGNENALLISVKNNYFDIAEMLIRAGANVNIGDRFNAAPLHYASLYGYADLSDMLIYYDADLNNKTSDGSTPLMASIWAGNVMITDLLIQNGARVEEKDNEGLTPFLLASYFGDTLIMDMLYRNGADIFARTNKGYNALSLMIMSENDTGMEYLLKLDKNWSGPERSVTDPYCVAAKYQRKDIIEILRKNKVPGNIKYEIDQVAVSVSSRLYFHDAYTGFTFTFKEPYLNLGFMTGLDTKLWYSRVLIKESEDVYYQYLHTGSVAFAGFFKDITLSRIQNRVTTDFSASLLGGYSFGNVLKGTSKTSGNKFKIIPSVSLRFTYLNLMVNAGFEYNRTDFYHTGPVWFRIGIGYNYYLDNIRTKIKFPKWY